MTTDLCFYSINQQNRQYYIESICRQQSYGFGWDVLQDRKLCRKSRKCWLQVLTSYLLSFEKPWFPGSFILSYDCVVNGLRPLEDSC